MHRIADGIASRNVQLPQQQHRRRRKIFAVATAGSKEKSRERGFSPVPGARLVLPHAVAEVLLEKTAEGAKRPFQIGVG